MKTTIQIASIATALVISACSSGTTSPQMERFDEGTRLRMQVVSPVSLAKTIATGNNLTIIDAAGTEFELTGARVVVGKVKFKNNTIADSTADDDSEIKGPIIADLLAGTMSPDPGTLALSSGTYNEIKVGIEKITEEMNLLEEADPMLGNSMHIQGSWMEDGLVKAFSIAIKFDEELRFENPEGFAVDSSASQLITIHFDATQWLSGIDFTACLHEEKMEFPTEGTLYINDSNAEGACDVIEERVKKNIKSYYEVKNEVED